MYFIRTRCRRQALLRTVFGRRNRPGQAPAQHLRMGLSLCEGVALAYTRRQATAKNQRISQPDVLWGNARLALGRAVPAGQSEKKALRVQPAKAALTRRANLCRLPIFRKNNVRQQSRRGSFMVQFPCGRPGGRHEKPEMGMRSGVCGPFGRRSGGFETDAGFRPQNL